MESVSQERGAEALDKPTASRRNASSILYNRYFRSRLVSLFLALAFFHIGILMLEALNSVWAHYKLASGEKPSKDSALYGIISDRKEFKRIQEKGAILSVKKSSLGIIDKMIDVFLVVMFFSHSLRKRAMRGIRRYKSFVRVNCSHIKEADVNLIVFVLFVLGLKSIVLEFVQKKKVVIDLIVPTMALVFRCVLVAPLIIWIFSSVYYKTRWFLVAAGYLSVLILMFIVNCTAILGDVEPGVVNVPYTAFPKTIRAEIERLHLKDRIFWHQDAKGTTPNAALVKAGSSRYVLILGNLVKYGEKEFYSFVAHEIGHADDLSTEKKMAATTISMGLSCGIILGLAKVLTPKYHAMGVSKFTTLFFIFMAHQYIMNSALKMFLNNLGILSEIKADLYAKRLGFGKDLAWGLFKLSVSTKSYIFPSSLYTHYAQDHPAISTRIEYLYTK